MAGNSIDNLQIKINSSAEGAVNQIDDLVKKLGKLTKALAQATVDPSIASGLDLIAKSAKKFNDSFGNISAEHVKAVGTSFKDLAAGINNVNKAINGVDFIKLANQASQLDTALDKKLNETLDEFGIKGKKNINLVKESFYGLMSELKSGNLEGALAPNVAGKALQALKDNARFAIEPSEDVREAQRLINAVKKAGTGGIGIDSRQATEVAQIKEGLDKYKNTFTTTGNANQSINEFISQNKLLVQIGLNEADTFQNLAQAINRALATLKAAENSTIGYDEAVKKLGMDETYAAQAINNIIDEYTRVSASQERAAQTQRQNAAAMQSVSGLYKQFAQGLREVAAVDIPEGRATNIANLAHAVSQFGYAKIQTATQVIPALTREINNMLVVLSESPEVSKNITRLINALARLTANGQTLKVATNAIANGMNKTGNSARQATPRITMFGNALKSIHGQSVNVMGSLRRLAGVFGTVYASLFMFVGAFHKLKEAIGYAADLTEIQNVVDVTFGNAAKKVDEFTQTSIRDFGMNELSVKTYAATFQQMGLAMGITNEQIKNAHQYLSQFRTPTGAINGYNEMSDSLADMSINLTKLTGDLASFRDKDQAEVARALQSGIMSGQTRPLREYGVDLTEATIKAWALKNGIDADYHSMTQAEKAVLRYQYAMERLGVAQGDFQRTAKTWANQVRVLKQNVQDLGKVVGQGLIQALKPALIAMNNFLEKVISFAEQVFNALGKIFGWKLDLSAAGVGSDLGEAEEAATGLGDALGGAGDAAGGAADKVKELNKQLQGFDKLNVLTTSETGGGTGGSGGSGGGSGAGGGGGAGGSANEVQASLEKTEGLFESSINDLYGLGTYIRDALIGAMESINWEEIYNKARNFGRGLAEFLNGLFSGTGEDNVFASLGRTVAGAINTALNFFDSFADAFDFSTFGRNLASFFVETISNIDWSLAGEAFHEWMQGIKDAFTAFVDYLWEHKDEVFKAIKDFLSEITIEDIAIFIGIMTISKIGKWVLAEGVLSLAGQAIGALFKGLGGIAIEKVGLSVGAFTAEELEGMTMMQAATKAIATALGFESVAAMATVGFVMAALVVLSIVAWKVAKDKEEVWEDASAAVQRLFDSGASGETIRASAAGKLVVDLETEYQGSFVNDLFGDMWNDYDIDENGNLHYNMTGFVGLKWMKDKWQSLKDWIKEKWSDITGGLGGGAWSETWSATVSDVTARFNVGIDWIKNKWTTFKDWVKEKIFGTNDANTTDLGERKITIGLKLETAFSNFKDWLDEKLGVKDGKSVTTANVTGKFSGWQQVSGGGALSGAWAYVKAFFNQWNKPNGGGNGVFNNAWSYVKGWFNAWNKPSGSGGGVFGGAWSYVKAWFSSWNRPSGSGGGVFGNAWSYVKAWFNSWNKPSGGGGGVFANAWSYVKAWFRGNALGGILTAAGWKPIQGYASGGMVDSAQIFMARENGLPEMVGTIGGHTAVMNNDQIVASVANGVASAVSGQNAILLQQNELLRRILAKEVGITSGDIFDAVRSENRNYTNRTGKSAFSF